MSSSTIEARHKALAGMFTLMVGAKLHGLLCRVDLIPALVDTASACSASGRQTC